jgi:3-dehydroquinate dehydratase-2
MTGYFRSTGTRWRIGIIDGPNMNTLGRRDKGTYGQIDSWEALKQLTQDAGEALGIEVVNLVSNYEGEILDWIHANTDIVDGWLINPAGLQTYGEGVRHALQESRKPYIETHFANTVKHFAKASPHIRLESSLTSTALGLTMGLRQYSYVASLVSLTMALDDEAFSI